MISIVIPTQDRGEAFRRALWSAAQQTLPAQEIVISDDGGAEETARIVAEARVAFPEIPIRHEVWGLSWVNITWNWMLGAFVARGPWIKYVFDDDWLEPHCLERMMSRVTPEVRVVSCGGWFEPGQIPCYDRYSEDWPIPESVRQGILSVSPVTTLIDRATLLRSFHQFSLLPPRCVETGVGPNVLMNYGQVLGSEQYRHAYLPERLVHLGGDDLPGERRSLTSRLKAEDPNTLYGLHGIAYDLIAELAASG